MFDYNDTNDDEATLTEEVIEALGEDKPAGRLAPKREKYVPTFEDPKQELKHLVLQHAAIVKQKVSIIHQNSPRKSHKTGEVIPCRIPFDTAEEMLAVAKQVLNKRASRLERQMLTCLEKMPVYQQFLSKVYGAGPIACSYLLAYCDIHKAQKSSSLRRYVGLAVIDGRLECATKGQVNCFVAKLRVVLFQMLSAMWRNAAKSEQTCKYLDIWTGAKHRILNSARVDQDGKILTEACKVVSAKGFAHSTGWHKAADIFIEDLYVVWRTLEGLPVWPTYRAAKLGYQHGGAPCDGAPRVMTLAEALEVVGEVGAMKSERVTKSDKNSEE